MLVQFAFPELIKYHKKLSFHLSINKLDFSPIINLPQGLKKSHTNKSFKKLESRRLLWFPGELHALACALISEVSSPRQNNSNYSVLNYVPFPLGPPPIFTAIYDVVNTCGVIRAVIYVIILLNFYIFLIYTFLIFHDSNFRACQLNYDNLDIKALNFLLYYLYNLH